MRAAAEIQGSVTPADLPRGRTRFALLLAMMALCSGLPGQSEPKLYDPDKGTCQVETIRRGYQANLLPWEDQPLVVRQRLRQLQATMTLDTLRECQARGLLSPEQAGSLEKELDLRATAAPEPAQSPTRP